MNKIIALLSISLICGCVNLSSEADNNNQSIALNQIDQLPMYGGFDRQSVPLLKKADNELISGVTQAFGSREKASQAFFEQGVRFYRVNNLNKAMKRFNQAWLINTNNAEVFWGFAMIAHDRRNFCEAKQLIDKALLLGLKKAFTYADAGRIYTLCAVSNRSLSTEQKNNLLKQSEGFYQKAFRLSPKNDYIYGSLASAYYWQGHYNKAKKMIEKQRAIGGTPDAKLVELLKNKE